MKRLIKLNILYVFFIYFLNFNMRRAFIGKVKSTLERVLLVESDEPEQLLPPTPEQMLALERVERLRERVAEVRRIIGLVGLRHLLRNNALSLRIRELLDGFRLDELPQDIINAVNDLPV